MTIDPDNTPTDWMEFRSDGHFVNTLHDCKRFVGRFHLHDGDIYLAIEPDGKFLANGMRPTEDRSQLLYTSPRTRNTATYQKVLKTKCDG